MDDKGATLLSDKTLPKKGLLLKEKGAKVETGRIDFRDNILMHVKKCVGHYTL